MQQGLLNQPQQGQMQGQSMQPSPQTTAPPQGMESSGMNSSQGTGASPEEQQMYETVVGQTTEYIYGEGLENVKQRIQAGAEDGVEDDIGAIVGNLLAMNYQSAMESGRSIPPIVMAGAAKELTEVVTDISVEMQLLTPQEADKAADEALYVSMATFGKSVPNMPTEEQQVYAQMIQELEAEEAQTKDSGMQPAAQPQP